MAVKTSLPDLFLFTDEPARDLESDHLSLRPFSSMVAAAALTNRGPFNIGVFSGWGQGKTSVLRQAKTLIEDQQKPNVVTAWVNAWQYEHEAHPIVPLLAIIINEITRAIDARKKPSEKEDDALATTFKDLKRALRSIAYGFSAKAGASIPGFANLEIGFVAKDMIDRDEKLSSDRDPLLDQSLYYHAYERLEKFRDQLAKITPADQPKIVVFIDDLDRCLPSKALHLLESLKLVLAQPGFIFVLGVDRHVIDSFLTKRYHREFGIRADKGHGRQYMDKIIQLPLDLPHHQNRFEEYIGNLIDATPSDGSIPATFRDIFTDPTPFVGSDKTSGQAFVAALAAGCDCIPRTLIRTLNYLLTDLFLRDIGILDTRRDPFTNSAEFLQFAAVSRITRITFGSEHERLYRKFLTNSFACQQISKFLTGKECIWDQGINMSEWGYAHEFGPDQYEMDLNSLSPYRAAISASDSLSALYRTPLGQKWLNEAEKRKAIESFLSIREEPNCEPDESSAQIIREAIREQLDLTRGGELHDSDREQIFRLILSNSGVKDLSELEGLTNLRFLSLNHTEVEDLTPLSKLIHLEHLELDNTSVSDITVLQNFTKLGTLYLGGTLVNDLSPLKSLSHLHTLYLSVSKVSDFTPLYGMKEHLKHLWIRFTPGTLDEEKIKSLRENLENTEIRP